MKEEIIMKRVQEHYDYLQSLGYEVVCTCLQGSQNYGLDEYSEEYMSDIDTKSIILPPLDDFIAAASPVSTVVIMDNNEHAEVKDIRIMFEMFKKMNLSYIEILYTDFKVVNPKYEHLISPLFQKRDIIASFNRNQFLRCISGMAGEKRKALCHPYPGLIEKIEKYGYDGKQLHHCARLAEFIIRYVQGTPLKECYLSKQKDKLMRFKKQLNEDGLPLSCKDAIVLCDFYRETVYSIAHENLTPEDEYVNEARIILKELQCNIIKERIREELLMDEEITIPKYNSLKSIYAMTVQDNKEDFETLYWTIAKLVGVLENKGMLDAEEITEILTVEPMPN